MKQWPSIAPKRGPIGPIVVLRPGDPDPRVRLQDPGEPVDPVVPQDLDVRVQEHQVPRAGVRARERLVEGGAPEAILVVEDQRDPSTVFK